MSANHAQLLILDVQLLVSGTYAVFDLPLTPPTVYMLKFMGENSTQNIMSKVHGFGS